MIYNLFEKHMKENCHYSNTKSSFFFLLLSLKSLLLWWESVSSVYFVEVYIQIIVLEKSLTTNYYFYSLNVVMLHFNYHLIDIFFVLHQYSTVLFKQAFISSHQSSIQHYFVYLTASSFVCPQNVKITARC